jgi:hypothetical protein
MPSQKQGRQSPEPETQTDSQAGTQAKPNDQSQDTNTGKSQDPQESLNNLESNPKHILADAAEEKTSKK